MINFRLLSAVVFYLTVLSAIQVCRSASYNVVSDDGLLLIRMKAHLAAVDGSLRPLDVSKAKLEHSVVGNYNVFKLIMETKEAEVIIELFSLLKDENRLYVNNVQILFKYPANGSDICIVSDMNGFRGKHVKCLESRQFVCKDISKNSGKESETSVAILVIDELEYEIVEDGSKHRGGEFSTAAGMCYGY